MKNSLIDELNRDYRDTEVIKVPVVPENLIPDDITAMGTIDKIQVGVDLEFVKPVYFNYRASSVSIISGISMEEIIAVAMAQYELISRLQSERLLRIFIKSDTYIVMLHRITSLYAIMVKLN